MTIDLDDRSTWPLAVHEWAARHAERLAGTTDTTEDLEIPLAGEEEFRALLGARLVAYHHTRLLDHEVAAIRERGLRTLSRELIEERIDQARQHGYLTHGQRDELRAANTFAKGTQRGRENLLALVIGGAIFDEPYNGCEGFVRAWGGEAMYGYPLTPIKQELHLSIGKPAIVVARVDPTAGWRRTGIAPEPAALFVGALLGTRKLWGEAKLRSSLPTADVLDIWQPGHPEYDRHASLPR